MIGSKVAWFFTHARDSLARGLIRLGVTPNMLTVFGTALTVAGSVFVFFGVYRQWTAGFPIAGVLLYFCCACDMLDGAVARLGNLASDFGGFLDSTLDRVSDFAIWAALAMGYALRDPANWTFAAGSMLALISAQLISYTKARAEDFIDDCSVGFWKRGERFTGVLCACFAANPGTLVVVMALTTPWTVWRRIRYTQQSLTGQTPIRDPRIQGRWIHRIQPWLFPRLSWPHDVTCIVTILVLLFLRIDPARWDVFRQWLAG